MRKEVVIWIHGIELSDDYDPNSIKDCVDKVKGIVGFDRFHHYVFNWSEIVAERERQVFNLVKYRGNYLTRKVRMAICKLGLDMWLYLSTKKGAKPGDWYYDIHAKLTGEVTGLVEKFKAEGFEVKLAFVGHSWGTKVALDWIVDHPEFKVKLVTIGSPVPMYGSSCFKDWGDPNLLANIEKWTNIGVENDPISNLMKDNPNPAWKGKVEDHDISGWQMFPILAHGSYWKMKKVWGLIAKGIS